MMGRLNHDQREFFYSFRLEEAVPDDHPERSKSAIGRAVAKICEPLTVLRAALRLCEDDAVDQDPDGDRQSPQTKSAAGCHFGSVAGLAACCPCGREPGYLRTRSLIASNCRVVVSGCHIPTVVVGVLLLACPLVGRCFGFTPGLARGRHRRPERVTDQRHDRESLGSLSLPLEAPAQDGSPS